MIRLLLVALLVLAIATPAAAAQSETSDRLVPPDAFPDSVLIVDKPIDTSDFMAFTDSPEALADADVDLSGWVRGWSDPEGSERFFVQAMPLGTLDPLGTLAGAQRIVTPAGRHQHPDHSDVVLMYVVDSAGQLTLMATFSDGTDMYWLAATGADCEVALDRLIEAQLARLTSPLVAQPVDLAETYRAPGASGVERAGYIFGQIFAYAAMAGLGWWLWSRHRKKVRESEAETG